ncbi:hypothetical protein CY652_17820 [Burkholderia sp. WAC0059]|uniref:hypothetical protein n=1 Tax=Burkholderia sp. WAC0059 TaxID=2066022 RepID=UPI000C7E8E12|nr:hypothetical protein [Burkholderia sp. WAC0059]PLZ01140.1 hypothetical protein CY652_17820 [Burkholderia sp. WAC0059]
MDFWTFVSKLIEALAWPGVVLYLILKFRDRFESLLGRLTEATLPGGITGKFSLDIEKAQEVVNEIPEPEPAVIAEIERGNPIEMDNRALKINPSGVIMEMWQKVLGQAKELLESGGALQEPSTAGRPLPPQTLFRMLETRNLVTPEEMKLVNQLHSIRNAVAHSQTQATPADADRYRAFSEKLILTWVVRIANGEPRQ